MEIQATNTNTLAPLAYAALHTHGVASSSRNGPVLRLPGVVTTTLTAPSQRVHFCEVRNANPFFHLFEAMAMLTDINDGTFLAFFAKNMLNYLDEGRNDFNAFYGTRMHRGDQFRHAISAIVQDKGTRRAYVDLWDIADINKNTKDMACNLGMLFDASTGYLNMTTFNRSNDAIWGFVSGANIVHFSFFHEFAALAAGIPMGEWNHVSANLHVYTENPQWRRMLKAYEEREWQPAWDYLCDPQKFPVSILPMFFPGKSREFQAELSTFMLMCVGLSRQMDLLGSFMGLNWHHDFIARVLKPMMVSWTMHKAGMELSACRSALAMMPPGNDWNISAYAWLDRNHKKSPTQ